MRNEEYIDRKGLETVSCCDAQAQVSVTCAMQKHQQNNHKKISSGPVVRTLRMAEAVDIAEV